MSSTIRLNSRSYNRLLSSVLDTEEGKKLVAVWKQEFVDPTAMAETTDRTIYNLAQKELIQTFIQALSAPHDLENIQIEYIDEDLGD